MQDLNLDTESDESLDLPQNVFAILSSYCQYTRLVRDIEYALQLEAIADQIYDNLPDEFKR